MKLKRSNISTRTELEQNLADLQTYLDYEVSATLLLLMSYIFHLTFYLAVGAALLLIPFMLKVLWQANRYGWITAFFILIVLPPVMVYLLLENTSWLYVACFTSLGVFYFYCGFLRLVIREWTEDGMSRFAKM